MKNIALFVALFAVVVAVASAKPTVLPFGLNDVGDAGGGVPCAACTIITSLLEQTVEIQAIPIDQLLEQICTWLPSPLDLPCKNLVDKYGAEFIKLVIAKEGPDTVCHELKICTDPTCNLFSGATSPFAKKISAFPESKAVNRDLLTVSRGEQKKLDPKFDPWEWLKNLINKMGNDHLPIYDLDGDDFSDSETLRGGNWRGRDCNDFMNNVYPGRNDSTGLTPDVDHNCNGIQGTSPQGVPYEELFCGNSGARGVAILGDSAAAHFSIPPAYMNASMYHKGLFDGALSWVEDEFDWPQLSGITGYMPTSAAIPVDSIYLRMRERNRCNHRNYQNVGVNGARAGAMAPPNGIINSFARNQEKDLPMLTFFALIGNDVCNGHHTLDTMTSVADFTASVYKSLEYLDTVLPKGSHVVFTGLVDGRILWDAMHNRTHPVGASYAEVYGFLNCLEISPCWVWLNNDSSVRDAGSAHAAQLSAVYSQIITNTTYKNFDMAYYDYPLQAVMDKWIAEGGEAWQLIEPGDGFHPAQITNYLMADVMWNNIMKDHPEFLGDVNPNNDLIDKLFGDQNGY